MEFPALLTLILFNLAGLIAIFFTSFGTFIIMAGAVLSSMMTGFVLFGMGTLLGIFILYAFGEVVEYLFVILGAKKFGASNAAVMGAVLGGIIGAIMGAFGFGVGIILGTFLGIFLGAFTVEYIIERDFKKSIKAGAGGVLGRAGSVAVKLIIAFIIFTIMIFRVLTYLSHVA